ncbi:MAG: hypothetical protein JRJ85_17645 [Deltaproteobacteria bacterium]|nr:hypothetical protein [Deltaproteobacteria bacterium]
MRRLRWDRLLFWLCLGYLIFNWSEVKKGLKEAGVFFSDITGQIKAVGGDLPWLLQCLMWGLSLYVIIHILGGWLFGGGHFRFNWKKVLICLGIAFLLLNLPLLRNGLTDVQWIIQEETSRLWYGLSDCVKLLVVLVVIVVLIKVFHWWLASRRRSSRQSSSGNDRLG